LFSKLFLPVITFLTALSFVNCGQHKPENKIYTVKKNFVYEIVPDTVPQLVTAINADTSYLEHVFKGYDLVNLSDLDSTVLIELRYADTNNFLRRDFYDGLRHAYFTCDLGIRLCNAQYFLHQVDSTLHLVILDAARPLHIQQMMWDSLEMDPDRKYNYLSPPYETSMHNYACAADVSIADASGQLLDMGSEYDSFQKLSQPVYEEMFIRSGELSQQAAYNRRLLRYVMKRAGLKGINSEWWHFALCTKQEAVARYPLIK